MSAALSYPDFHDSLEGIAPPCASVRLVGHRSSWRELANIIRSGHHAILLDGEQGIGKATSAFHLAQACLSGSAVETDPPLLSTESATWRQVASAGHPNLIHLTRGPNATGNGYKTVIAIDDVRRTQHFLSLTPSIDAPRIVIIDPVDDMQRPAANALLKILEEPPVNTLFLLISHGAGGLLPTIRSRCQRVRFAPLDDQAVAQVLEQVGAGVLDQTDIGTLAALAGGRPRDALLLALHGGVELRETLDRLLTGPDFDVTTAHKLADVAGARDGAIHDRMLRDMLADSIQQAARLAATTGKPHQAGRLADFAVRLGQQLREGQAFGLDRRQEFLVAAARTHKMLHQH